MFQAKKDKTLRLCVDFRRINELTIKNRYPLPLISEILSTASKGSIFSKLELRGAYNLVRIKENHEWKTAFRTPFGLSEYLLMPFGLTNAPACFQHLMDELFRDIISKFVVVYLDDILIYSSDLQEHILHVRVVLTRLRQFMLYAKMEKCLFHVREVEFLGYFLSNNSLKMDPARISAILDWPIPKSVKQLQSFLGFASF
jgi:hypothetical protein